MTRHMQLQMGLQKLAERALAFAHAAVDEPTPFRILEARGCAERLLPALDQLQNPAFTLSDADRIVGLVAQLRAVLDVLDRRIHPAHRSPLHS